MDATPATAGTAATTTAAPPRIAPEAFAERAHAIEAEVGKVIVGQRELVRHTLVGLLNELSFANAACVNGTLLNSCCTSCTTPESSVDCST